MAANFAAKGGMVTQRRRNENSGRFDRGDIAPTHRELAMRHPHNEKALSATTKGIHQSAGSKAMRPELVS
jgi:hypothetical protein